MKRVLSLALALVMCLSLAVPAFAAGTTETVNMPSYILTVTNVVKVVKETYSVGGYPDAGGGKTGEETFTILVVSDSGYTLTREAAPGYIYWRDGLSEKEESKVASRGSVCRVWEPEQKYFYGTTGDGMYLEGPERYTAEAYDPEVDNGSIEFYDIGNYTGILYESKYAKLVRVTGVTPAASQTASPTNDKLTVNGVVQNPTVYKINGNNYFKIRDLAAMLNGTGKQFDVGYDGTLKSVTATTGKGYAKLKGDLAGPPAGGAQTANPSNDTIYIDGQKIDAAVYKINGNNYFKLRDLGKALNFYVGWTQADGVFIDTSKPYSK